MNRLVSRTFSGAAYPAVTVTLLALATVMTAFSVQEPTAPAAAG